MSTFLSFFLSDDVGWPICTPENPARISLLSNYVQGHGPHTTWRRSQRNTEQSKERGFKVTSYYASVTSKLVGKVSLSYFLYITLSDKTMMNITDGFFLDNKNLVQKKREKRMFFSWMVMFEPCIFSLHILFRSKSFPKFYPIIKIATELLHILAKHCFFYLISMHFWQTPDVRTFKPGVHLSKIGHRKIKKLF